jgi:hypothetical protein
MMFFGQRACADQTANLSDGHYTGAKIGCGAICILMAAVDHQKGDVVGIRRYSPTGRPALRMSLS